MTEPIRPILSGAKAMVVGIANDQSIAYGCAKAFRSAGAEVAVTWLNEKARPHVEPLDGVRQGAGVEMRELLQAFRRDYYSFHISGESTPSFDQAPGCYAFILFHPSGREKSCDRMSSQTKSMETGTRLRPAR